MRNCLEARGSAFTCRQSELSFVPHPLGGQVPCCHSRPGLHHPATAGLSLQEAQALT